MSPQVPPEVWAADEQDLLLLLEPQEFLQGVGQLIQVSGRGVILLHESGGAGFPILDAGRWAKPTGYH